MNLKEMREKRVALAKKLVELGKLETLSDDQRGELERVRQEFNDLGEKIKLAEDVAAAERYQTDMSQSAGRVSGIVTPESAAQTNQGRETHARQPIDYRPMGQRVVESEQFHAFRERGLQGNTGAIPMGSFYRGRFLGAYRPDLSPQEAQAQREGYTLIDTAALPSAPPMIAPYRRPEIAMPDIREFNVRDGLSNLSTTSNSIEFWRELLFTNAAAPTAEGIAAPESALTFEGASVTVKRIPHYIPVTQIALDDEPRLRGLIEGRLLDGLRIAEDDQLMTGSGAGENIRGILNVSGIQAVDAVHFAANPVENAGNAWEDFDRITRAKRLVRITGRARANVVYLAPEDKERLETITDLNGAYYAGSPFAESAVTRMRGLLVIETESLTEGTSVVLDSRLFEVYDREDGSVMAGWINDDFVKGKLALLAQERLAFAPIRPAGGAVVDLTSI